MNQLPTNHRLSLIQSFFCSLFLHGFIAFSLGEQLVRPDHSKIHETPLLSKSLELLKERETRNIALRESFKEVQIQTAAPLSPKTTNEKFVSNFSLSLPSAATNAQESFQVSLPFPVDRFSLPAPLPLPSLDIAKEITLPEKKVVSHATSLPIDAPIYFVDDALAKSEPIYEALDMPEIHFENTLPNLQTVAKRTFSLPALPALSKLEAKGCLDWFNTELLFLPVEDEEGAQFAVTLLPSSQLDAKRLSQDFIFLIDRSNSIQKERLFATKHALSRVLRELSPEDRFNIVAFDNKVDKLFVVPMAPTKENLSQAFEFLHSIELGSFFSPSDLYRPLLFALPNQSFEERLTHIVLLSDGEALQKKAIQTALLQDWTQRNKPENNQGACLYAIALESDHNTQSLDALCALNRGKLFTAPTSRGIRKKLLRLIKMVDHPIASDCTVTAINKRTGKSIPLSKQYNPCLFLGQPTVVLGTIEKLDDFILFIQAKIDGKWVHVKKNLSFLYAKRGGRALRTEIALHKAYMAYLQYSEDNDSKHLSDARDILEPFDLLPAFQ